MTKNQTRKEVAAKDRRIGHYHDQLEIRTERQRSLARLMVTTLSSIGWRMTSRARVPNSGNSSRNRTPRCAKEISPGKDVMDKRPLRFSVVIYPIEGD